MAKTNSPRLGLTRWSAGTDTIARTDFDGDHADLDSNVMLYKQGTLASRPAAGIEGRFYTVKGDATPSNNNRQYYDNGTEWVANNQTVDQYITASAAGNQALTLRGAASQTADIFRINTNADAATLFRVTASGVATNQATPGTTAGAYLGLSASHDAAGLFVSVAVGKPVLVARGITSQSSNIIVAQDNSAATLFSVSPAGAVYAAGTVSANAVAATSGLSGATLGVTGTSTLKTSNLSPTNASSVGLTLQAVASQSTNLFEFKTDTGTRVARYAADGTFATNRKIYVGNNQGDTTGGYANTVANLTVYGSGVSSSTPAARIVADAAQTSNIFEIQDSGAVTRYWINSGGSTGQDGNASSGSAYIGSAGGTPIPNFVSGIAPKFEVLTGSAAGTYDDNVVYRHSNQDATAVSRKITLRFQMSSEANSGESGKWAGIGSQTSSGNAGNPGLVFYTGGTEAARIDSANNMALVGGLTIPSPQTLSFSQTSLADTKINLYANTYQIGVQPNSFYQRTAGAFYWYQGGTHSASEGNAGSGGTTIATLTSGSDNRFSVGRLSLTSNGAASDMATAPLNIGTYAQGRVSMQVGAIARYAANSNSTLGDLYINGSVSGDGGRILLGAGDTSVIIGNRTLWVGTNRVYFGSSTWDAQGGAPIQNDWWFDHGNNQIKIRNASAQWKIVADDAAFP